MALPDKAPRWATDGGATLEPGEADKDAGWGTDIRPPARWQNWLQENCYQHALSYRAMANRFWNPASVVLPGGATARQITGMYYDAGSGFWQLATHDSGVSGSYEFYRSRDGVTWIAPTTPGVGGAGAVQASYAAAGGAVLRAADGVYRSVDGGDVWSDPDTAENWHVVVVSPTTGTALVFQREMSPDTERAVTRRSLDDGSTWGASIQITPAAQGGFSGDGTRAAVALASGTLLASTVGVPAGVYRSVDDGLTWAQVDGFLPTALLQDPTGRVWGVNSSGPNDQIAYSDDDGLSWFMAYDQVAPADDSLTAFGDNLSLVWNASELLIVTGEPAASGAGAKIYATTDGADVKCARTFPGVERLYGSAFDNGADGKRRGLLFGGDASTATLLEGTGG